MLVLVVTRGEKAEALIGLGEKGLLSGCGRWQVVNKSTLTSLLKRLLCSYSPPISTAALLRKNQSEKVLEQPHIQDLLIYLINIPQGVLPVCQTKGCWQRFFLFELKFAFNACPGNLATNSFFHRAQNKFV